MKKADNSIKILIICAVCGVGTGILIGGPILWLAGLYSLNLQIKLIMPLAFVIGTVATVFWLNHFGVFERNRNER